MKDPSDLFCLVLTSPCELHTRQLLTLRYSPQCECICFKMRTSRCLRDALCARCMTGDAAVSRDSDAASRLKPESRRRTVRRDD